MKRRVAIALLLLFLGAIVNIAVAWGFAAWAYQDSWYAEVKREVPLMWPSYLERAGWPPPVAATEQISGMGVRVIVVDGGHPDVMENDWVRLEIRQFGIPTHALQWESHGARRGGQMLTDAHESAGLRKGIDISTRRADGSIDLRSLPLIPVLPSFIINTLFYALLLWLLFFAPFGARRMLRRRRGQCEKCAYPIGVSPVCTECGGMLRRAR